MPDFLFGRAVFKMGYRVLLAEDEVIVRHGIRSLLDQSGLDLRIVADVENGSLAWDAFCACSPEIVITDLRMPVMDGLELIRKIREVSSQTLIIILTCLDDFELVQKAIELNVFSYLLKLSAGPDEILAALRKAITKLDETHRSAKKWFDRHLVISQLFDDYILYGRIDAQTFCSFISRTGISLREENLRLYFLRFQEPDGEASQREALSQEEVLDQLERYFEKQSNAEIYARNDHDYIIICNEPEQDGLSPSERCSMLLSRLESGFDVPFSIGVSDPGNGFSELPALYQNAYSDLCGQSQGSGFQQAYVQICKDYIGEHFAEPLSLKIVASTIGITPNYLSGLFVRYAGETFTSYLNKIRIEQVKRLMEKPGCATGALGRRVGYDNESYFIRVFKKATGMTPSQYREKHMRL